MAKYIVVASKPGGEQGLEGRKGLCTDHSYWRKRGEAGAYRSQAVPATGLNGQETCVAHSHSC